MAEFYDDEMYAIASRALHEMWNGSPDDCLDCKDDMGPVLDKVAPLIAAKALRDFADLFEKDISSTVAIWLSTRADDIEDGR